MPIHSRHSLGDKNNPFKDLPDNQYFDELNVENLQYVRDQCRESAFEQENSLLFIDDMTSYLKNPENLKMLNDLVNNRRHLRLSLWFCVQNVKSIPLSNRKVITQLFLFKPSNLEFVNVCEEFLQLSKDDSRELRNYVFREPHDFLLIRLSDNTLYRNFNLLEFQENNSDI